jgi:hypothetical protein
LLNATVKSLAARVEDVTDGGRTETTVPAAGAKPNVNLSPVWSEAGTVNPIDEIVRRALPDWPAVKTAGVMPKVTLLLDCAKASGPGATTVPTTNERMIANDSLLLREIFR